MTQALDDALAAFDDEAVAELREKNPEIARQIRERVLAVVSSMSPDEYVRLLAFDDEMWRQTLLAVVMHFTGPN